MSLFYVNIAVLISPTSSIFVLYKDVIIMSMQRVKIVDCSCHHLILHMVSPRVQFWDRYCLHCTQLHRVQLSIVII